MYDRIIRNPFGLRERCGEVTDKEGVTHKGDEEIAKAFMKHNLITVEVQEAPYSEQVERVAMSWGKIQEVRRALRKTQNMSAVEPDVLSWRLLK